MRTRSIAGIVAGLTLFVACGDDSNAPVADPAEPEAAEAAAIDPADEMAEPGADENADPAEGSVPTAIVSLSPTATEMLYAIGAGDQVIAVDDFSNHPPETADKMLGVSAFDPSVEAIAALEPDLVVTDGANPDLLGQLDTLGIPHWEGPAAVTFDDVYDQIEQLGSVTGHPGEAADLVESMRADVAAVAAELPTLDEAPTYYHELDATLYSATSDTFIGTVYDHLGLVNIADEVGADTSYPQLSAEFIITENPDLIFLACAEICGETAETVAARPGWDELDAVRTGGVVELDDDISSRWGPRMVDFLRAVGDAVEQVALGPAG